MAEISNVIGIIGVSLVLVAYYLIQSHRVKNTDFNYSMLNLVGAILILVSLMYHWNLASVVIEIAWITISLGGLYRWSKLHKLQLCKKC